MTDVNCWLNVEGSRFADTGPAILAGTPTALADLSVTWGRATTVDQPTPASCKFTIHDRTGSGTVLTVIDVGNRVDVWASGDISSGAPVDVAVDGSFETLTVGASGYPRFVPDPAGSATTIVVSAPVATGTRAVRASSTMVIARTILVPPASFSTIPTAWDNIPRFIEGATWQWSLTVRAPRDVPPSPPTAWAGAVVFVNPSDTTGIVYAGPMMGVGGDGEWHTVGGKIVGTPTTGDQWLGVQVRFEIRSWQDGPTGTWADTPGSWEEYGMVVFDDQQLFAPPTGLERDVLVFSGRVTDLTASIDDREGTLAVEVTAVDQLADLANRYVGDTPWPSETVAARFAAIITASAADVDTRLDTPLDTLMVTRRDVDNQPTAGLLQELAQGVDGVLWSATHATTGPYLWLENPSNRAGLGSLTLSGGIVVVVPPSAGQRPAGRTELDGCDLPDDDIQWVRDVTTVVTRVDATWMEQTTPDVTERTLRVVDAAAEQTGRVNRYGVTTPLINATDATNVANRILTRTRYDDWIVEGLEYDLGLAPPAAGTETAAALDLLDGTIRLGRPVLIYNVTRWPAADTVAVFLEGGVYQYDGAWRLGLVGSPYAGMGQSGGWNTLDPTWRWNQMDPTMAWVDLYGVTGPVAA